MNTLKQLTAWATDLKNKYIHDIGFTTHVKIASYLLTYTILVIGGFVIARNAQYDSLVKKMELPVLQRHMLYDGTEGIFFLLLFMSVLFSAILTCIAISKLTVNPIRNAFALQKRFVSGIAHELRTPLSTLRINNEITRFNAEPNSELANLCDENMADIDMIDARLNVILLFDRMLSAESLQFKPVDIKKLLLTVTKRLTALAAQKNIAVSFSLGQIPLLCVNQTALEHAFFNVLENAITHTLTDKTVTVSSTTEPGFIFINIKDSGPGISPEDIPHIFEPFYRSEKAGKLSGTSIGLATVEEIMRLHFGTIKVTDNTKTGTTFTFCIPESRSS